MHLVACVCSFWASYLCYFVDLFSVVAEIFVDLVSIVAEVFVISIASVLLLEI